MHQHLADNQHAEPIGLLRGAGDEVQLLCTRLKKSEFHIIQSDAQLFPAEQRIELMPSASHRLEASPL